VEKNRCCYIDYKYYISGTRIDVQWEGYVFHNTAGNSVIYRFILCFCRNDWRTRRRQKRHWSTKLTWRRTGPLFCRFSVAFLLCLMCEAFSVGGCITNYTFCLSILCLSVIREWLVRESRECMRRAHDMSRWRGDTVGRVADLQSV